jgi:hypothetical protein
MRCEARTLDDIRALGGNDAAEERRFATVARVSEANLALYRTFAQPIIRSLITAPMAKWVYGLHPLRLQYEMFSDANPFMEPLEAMANSVRESRRPADKENPFTQVQEQISHHMTASLDAWRDWRDTVSEHVFLWVYGSPALQAIVGIDPNATESSRRAPKTPFHRELLRTRIANLKSCIPTGGLREAVVRSVLYIGMGRGSVDERGFEMVRRIRDAQRNMPALPLAAFKSLVREQFLMLLIDSEAALAAIPAMLPPEIEMRVKALDVIKSVLTATRGELNAEETERNARIVGLFGVDRDSPATRHLTPLPASEKKARAKAS